MSDKSDPLRLTPLEQAMLYERMSGQRLSDADRQHVLNGGKFVPPHRRPAPSAPASGNDATPEPTHLDRARSIVGDGESEVSQALVNAAKRLQEIGYTLTSVKIDLDQTATPTVAPDYERSSVNE